MKRTINRAAPFYGVKPEKAGKAAFWWTFEEYGDLITVKAGKEKINLALKKRENGSPMYYESAPIERATAETLLGFKFEADEGNSPMLLRITKNFEPKIYKVDDEIEIGGIDPGKVSMQ